VTHEPAESTPLRLPPVASPTEEQRELIFNGMERDGVPLNIFTTLAHSPGLLRRVNMLGGRFLFRGKLEPRLREIVILRSAYLSGSEYEFGQHRLIGRTCGLTDTEIAALATSDGGGGWSQTEQLAIALAGELHNDDVASDATWAGLRDALDDAQLVELLLLPGFYRMLAGFLNSAGVQLEPDAPGWPPHPAVSGATDG